MSGLLIKALKKVVHDAPAALIFAGPSGLAIVACLSHEYYENQALVQEYAKMSPAEQQATFDALKAHANQGPHEKRFGTRAIVTTSHGQSAKQARVMSQVIMDRKKLLDEQSLSP